MIVNVKVIVKFCQTPAFRDIQDHLSIYKGIVQDLPMHQLIFKEQMILQIENPTVAQELFHV